MGKFFSKEFLNEWLITSILLSLSGCFIVKIMTGNIGTTDLIYIIPFSFSFVGLLGLLILILVGGED